MTEVLDLDAAIENESQEQFDVLTKKVEQYIEQNEPFLKMFVYQEEQENMLFGIPVFTENPETEEAKLKFNVLLSSLVHLCKELDINLDKFFENNMHDFIHWLERKRKEIQLEQQNNSNDNE